MIDTKGNLIVDYTYDDVMPFSEGLALVVKNDEAGYIDLDGNIVIELSSENCYWYGTTSSNVELDEGAIGGKWIYYDSFYDGLTRIRKSDGTWCYKDTNGDIVIELENIYKFVSEFSEGLAYVQNNDGKLGYIDKTGEIVIEPKYSGAGLFSEGLAWVEDSDDNRFCIDTEGNIVIDKLSFEIEEQSISSFWKCGNFNNDLAIIVTNDVYVEEYDDYYELYGVINTDGELVVPFEYLYIGDWGNGMFHAQTLDEEDCFIDTEGNILFYTEYASDYSEGLCIFDDYDDSNNRCFGFSDAHFNVVIEPIYSWVSYFSEGLALVQKDGKYGYINRKGEVIIGNIE